MRQTVERDRRAWAEFLMQPKRKKATRVLTRGGEQRCCLGHACALFLGRPRHSAWLGESEELPQPLADRLGMWGIVGCSHGGFADLRGQQHRCLARINDDTDATPQQIGAYLLTVIEGGDDTPFRPLNDFPAEA